MTKRSRPSHAPYNATSDITDAPSSSVFLERLRGPETSTTLPFGPITTKPKLDSRRKDLYDQFCASLPPESSSRTAPVAQPDIRADKNDVTALLRESLAETGSALHASAIDMVLRTHQELDREIEDFAEDATPVQQRANSLYEHLTCTLSSTLCHSDSMPRATIADHLATLQQTLDDAEKELKRLAAEYDVCVKDGESTVKKLRMDGSDADSDTGAARMELKKTESFKKEAEELARSTAQHLDEVDTEFRENVQRETMKIMQTMMVD